MLTDQHIDALRSADRALTDATFRLAMAVDFAASVLPAWHLPTDVLKALDDYRETVAQMWPFFTAPEYVERPTSPSASTIATVLAEPENGWIDPTCSIPGCWQATQFTDGAKSYCWDHHPSYAVPAGPTQDQLPACKYCGYHPERGDGFCSDSCKERYASAERRAEINAELPSEIAGEQATQAERPAGPTQDQEPRRIHTYCAECGHYMLFLLSTQLDEQHHCSACHKLVSLISEEQHLERLRLAEQQRQERIKACAAELEALNSYTGNEQATQDQEPLYSDERETWPHVEQATPEPEPKDDLHCVCVGCQNPATVQIGEFWYCETHQADPIPF